MNNIPTLSTPTAIISSGCGVMCAVTSTSPSDTFFNPSSLKVDRSGDILFSLSGSTRPSSSSSSRGEIAGGRGGGEGEDFCSLTSRKDLGGGAVVGLLEKDLNILGMDNPLLDAWLVLRPLLRLTFTALVVLAA
eukprot:GHVT01011363.1.p1 GENE.GHVT01011363.1~~GHVT01011363.1.p1  ORF type:complete len:134 (-),score=5.26 GHVT01011363.1:197-598(-)